MTIIDSHAHTNGGNLGNYKAGLLSSRALAQRSFKQSEEQLKVAVDHHINTIMNEVGTDIQFISPRPFQLMHSETPSKIVHYYCEASNDVDAMTVKIAPDRYRAVASIPQVPNEPVKTWIPELERCVNELGMIGLIINPDPWEGRDIFPGMGDEVWFPLYEKMVELDVPALIHSATTVNPWDYYQNYFITTETSCILQMVEKRVFKTFPNLKIIVAHGGGSIPYQVGRWRARMRGARAVASTLVSASAGLDIATLLAAKGRRSPCPVPCLPPTRALARKAAAATWNVSRSRSVKTSASHAHDRSEPCARRSNRRGIIDDLLSARSMALSSACAFSEAASRLLTDTCSSVVRSSRFAGTSVGSIRTRCTSSTCERHESSAPPSRSA